MIKFETQESKDHVWVVAFDTVCSGWNCVMTDENGEDVICLHTSEEADVEVLEDKDSYFKIHMDEYLHERTVSFNGNIGQINGIKPQKQ